MTQYYSTLKNEKKNNIFEKNFNELMLFLKKHGKFPEQKDNPSLYQWTCALRNKKKTGDIHPHIEERLNAIGFIWSKHDFRWQQNLECIKNLLHQNILPLYNTHHNLYQWAQTQAWLVKQQKLPAHKVAQIEELNTLIKKVKEALAPEPIIKIPARELKWGKKLEELIEFRKQNSDSWPQVEAEDIQQKKLGIWCQDLRCRFREGILEGDWFLKLSEISFNFEGRHDNWKERFNELKNYIKAHDRIPGAYHKLYSWCRLQYKVYNELNKERQELLSSINFLQYFKEKDWNQQYEEVKEYILSHKKTPTQKSNEDLYGWLTVQRSKFRNNKLTEKELKDLTVLGIDLDPVSTRENNWETKFDALVKFRQKSTDKWPSALGDEIEKRLYEWCQTQRQVFAGTAKNRKALSQERIDKLNQIGFHWSHDELINKNWKANFQNLKEFITQNNTVAIPAYVNGKQHSLYAWLRKQKKAIEKNRLSQDKINRLSELGAI